MFQAIKLQPHHQFLRLLPRIFNIFQRQCQPQLQPLPQLHQDVTLPLFQLQLLEAIKVRQLHHQPLSKATLVPVIIMLLVIQGKMTRQVVKDVLYPDKGPFNQIQLLNVFRRMPSSVSGGPPVVLYANLNLLYSWHQPQYKALCSVVDVCLISTFSKQLFKLNSTSSTSVCSLDGGCFLSPPPT